MKNYLHLSRKEREFIELHLRKKDMSITRLAALLGRHRSTIYREIKKGLTTQRKKKPYLSNKSPKENYITYSVYFSDVGQRYADLRQGCRAGKYKILKDLELMRYIDKCLLEYHYTPAAIVGGLSASPHTFSYVPSPKSIYDYIDLGLMRATNMDLPLKCRVKQKNKRNRKHKRILGRSIDERPAAVNERTEIGHFEADSIVGENGKSSILTLTSRTSRAGVLLKVKGRTADETLTTFADYIKTLPKGIIRSITFDNGSEFAACARLEELFGSKIYFAHPYSAWERGSNENFNGLVRRFIPKGKDLFNYTQQDLNRIASIINAMPRKVLGYKTAAETWAKESEQLASLSLADPL